MTTLIVRLIYIYDVILINMLLKIAITFAMSNITVHSFTKFTFMMITLLPCGNESYSVKL